MTALMTLDHLKIGSKAIITKVLPELNNRTRYAGMGIIKNSVVEVKRIAPLGDPMVLKIMGYELSLRKDEASHIEIEIVK